MQSKSEILDGIERVEEGSEIIWNGRKHAYTVTSTSENSFEVEGEQGAHYRFYFMGADAPYFKNLNGGQNNDIDEFFFR
jgi:hypothetical protein